MSSTIPATSGIYRITCVITGKIYIGSAVNLDRRRYHHFFYLQRNEHHNRHMQRAWNKYGKDAFVFEVLELALIPFLLEREQYWLDTLKPDFNMSPIAGSTLGRKFSPEAKEKIRLKALGRKPSVEIRQNMAESHKGSKRSTATRAKMSARLIGNTRGHGGKLTPEQMKQRRLARNRTKRSVALITATLGKRKTLIVTSPDGIEYSVVGIRQFCREHNLDRSTLLRVTKGKISHHKGWKARFPD